MKTVCLMGSHCSRGASAVSRGAGERETMEQGASAVSRGARQDMRESKPRAFAGHLAKVRALRKLP